MIRSILKQMWNTRRSNLWIGLELVLVAYFMWGVIDPVYVLLSNRAIPNGFNTDNVVNVYVTPRDRRNYSPSVYPSQAEATVFELIRDYPGVTAAAMNKYCGVPAGRYGDFRRTVSYDTARVSEVVTYGFVPGDDIFKVFDIRDISTGEAVNSSGLPERSLYLSTDLVKSLALPAERVKGTQVYITTPRGDSAVYTVAGVIRPLKVSNSSAQPSPSIFLYGGPSAASHVFGIDAFIRIRDDLSPTVFIEAFAEYLREATAGSTLEYRQTADYGELWSLREEESGAPNRLRLQTGLAVFFLLCTFLGMAGTFWLRGRKRRGEIGLRMAMGASRRRILHEFLGESWLLTTLGWIIGVFIVFQRVYAVGFAEAPALPNDAYIQNRFWPHFIIVSIIVYLLMLTIAAIGTWIPAWQAAKTVPSEALSSE